MDTSNKYSKPYDTPSPRSFSDWCHDLGLVSYGQSPSDNSILTYDEFCFFPGSILRKETKGSLYGFWRSHDDAFGECRTVQEWLHDYNWKLADPIANDLEDLNIFLGHDEFWNWSNGKVVDFAKHENSWEYFQRLFKHDSG